MLAIHSLKNKTNKKSGAKHYGVKLNTSLGWIGLLAAILRPFPAPGSYKHLCQTVTGRSHCGWCQVDPGFWALAACRPAGACSRPLGYSGSAHITALLGERLGINGGAAGRAC